MEQLPDIVPKRPTRLRKELVPGPGGTMFLSVTVEPVPDPEPEHIAEEEARPKKEKRKAKSEAGAADGETVSAEHPPTKVQKKREKAEKGE